MISLVSQMLAFAVMVATGFMVGCMFDIYRVIRTLTRPRAKGTFIMDLCFWLWVTPAFFSERRPGPRTTGLQTITCGEPKRQRRAMANTPRGALPN